jgi:hypothetical protein
MIPGMSATFGAGSAPSFQGGASSGGNQEIAWGDNTGSQMIMGGGKESRTMLIVIGAVACVGILAWAMKKK